MKRFSFLFIPHEKNDYTPDLLQKTALLIMAGLAVISFAMSNVYALLWQQSTWLVGAVLPAVVFDKTNDERLDNGLQKLVRNPILDEAARMKAEDMAVNGYFSHYSPSGVSPWHWFEEVDYNFAHAGENLAVHFSDSKEVVNAWMDSPTHRANIVNSNYREIGIGTAKGMLDGYSTVFVVQLFGTPGVESTSTLELAGIAVSPEVVDDADEIVIAAVDGGDAQVAGVEVVKEELDLLAPIPVSAESCEYSRGGIIKPATQNPVVLYSDTISASTNLVPVTAAVASETPVPESELAKLATSPSSILQRIYLGFGVLAVVSLLTSVFIEWRIQRHRQVLYGVLLLCGMSLLFWVHILVTAGSLVL